MAQRKPLKDDYHEEGRAGEFGEQGRRRDDYRGRYGSQPLADRGSRLVARIIDGLLLVVAMLPGLILIVAGGAVADSGKKGGDSPATVLLTFGGLALLVMFGLGLYVYQVVLLARYGQTIGKRTMKVKIVKMDDDSEPGLVHAWLLRDLVPAFIGGVPCIGGIFSVANVLFIFGEPRRCIHDYIANTQVVEA